MKILIIANHLLDSKISSGGDRIFVEMAKRWGKWGASLTLLAPEVAADNVAMEVGAKDKIVIPRSPFDNLQQKAVWAILPLYLHRTLKVLGLLQSVNADAIYTTGDFFCDVLPAFYLKKKLKAKWVANIYHINESPFVRKGNSFLASSVSFLLQRMSFALMKRSATVVFLLNQKVRNDLVKLGFEPEKLVVTGLGIDLKKIEKLRLENASPKVAAKKFDGCFLGRLNPTKGIFDLPKIWQKVVEEIPKAKLVIIGGGDTWAEKLRSQITSLGLEKNIKLVGFVDEEEKVKILGQSRVFVFPSYEEGWGIAVAEAMAAGLPVVAYDLPSYKEVFPEALLTVETGNATAMSAAVLGLLRDESKYRSWQEKGYTVVQRYDLDQIAKEQWGIIKNLFQK